jgi:N-acetylglucosaminyldiphosphoundecaprenol N-acetyl-beta-D-mannosaminyltransferase
VTAPESQTYDVCGISIAALTPRDAAITIVQAASQGRALEAHLCNAYTLSLVDRDPRLAGALRRAQLNLPDGTPVAWLGRPLGVREPVRGPGLVHAVAEIGAAAGVRHYFYGGAPGVAEELAERLRRQVSGLEVAGWESPPFGEPTEADLDRSAALITDSRANVVWVGMGTPRQDYLVPPLAERTAAVVVPVGAAFDFLTGRVKEAPESLHGTGLEWLYRLVAEPRRLWSRYLIGNPRFMRSAVRHKVQQRS